MTLQKLWQSFGDWQYAWEMAKESDFLRAGLDTELVQKIFAARNNGDLIRGKMAFGKIDPEREYEKLWERDIVLISRDSAEYPEQLRQIPCPPFLIYRKGAKLVSENFWKQQGAPSALKKTVPLQRYVAIVGTRLPSFYGEKITAKIGEDIALSGGIIVSGLAYGIDAIAHYAAVKNDKPTVVVLASGIEKITPSAHYSLARKILETGGTLISEYAGGNVSFKSNFLERNRLISGLCKSTIVIEAKEKSGALITAHHALEQGREIYALIGDILKPQAQGCIKLLMQGAAHPIFAIEELMQQLGFDVAKNREQNLSPEEKIILDLLKIKAVNIAEIAFKTGLNVSVLNTVLTQLEIKGLVSKNGFNKWKNL